MFFVSREMKHASRDVGVTQTHILLTFHGTDLLTFAELQNELLTLTARQWIKSCCLRRNT